VIAANGVYHHAVVGQRADVIRDEERTVGGDVLEAARFDADHFEYRNSNSHSHRAVARGSRPK
jgi:hypothetical protein